ncbi:MAG: HD domain-containing protein [Clostridia bacterium]|nr:HD domain-containing protein [Clostridia bacterium]
MPDYKEKFISIFCEKISRNGAEELLNWLRSTDFFSAPASTKFHCAKEGGLVEHSVKVYEVLREKHFEPSDDEESFAICALLHDVCKINFYKVSSRNVKNELTGVWEKVPYYATDDSFPYGHGEKSVFLIERFMRLKPAEAVAIRWHMGGFDDAVKGGGYNSPIAFAFDKYPLSVKLFIADLESTYLREKGTSAVKKHF